MLLSGFRFLIVIKLQLYTDYLNLCPNEYKHRSASVGSALAALCIWIIGSVLDQSIVSSLHWIRESSLGPI